MRNFLAAVISLAFFGCLTTIPAQILVPGVCPNHTVVQNFSVGSYLGAWYEIENTFTWFQIDSTCVVANYSDFGNGSVRVENTQINNRTGELESIVGHAELADPSKNEAKLLVSFPVSGAIRAPYWVLDSDYSNYSIVWSCSNFGTSSFQTYWFLSRTRNASESVRDYVHGYLTGLNFDLSNMAETDQTNCPN